MLRYCPPHAPGEVWRPELHGLAIRSATVCARTYDFAGLALAEAAKLAGIPTGVPVPVAVVTILGEAMLLEPRWIGTAASFAEQRQAHAEWQARRDWLFERAREILDDAEFRCAALVSELSEEES